MNRFVLVCALLAAARPALADPADAEKHVARATKLHAAGRYADALVQLKAAYEIDPRPRYLFAIGQLHALLDDCASAIPYYDGYLATEPPAESARLAQDALVACGRPELDKPARADTEPAVEDAVAPPPRSAPAATSTHGDSSETVSRRRLDPVAITLTSAGLVAGIAGALFYGSARSVRADADLATSYDLHIELVDTADRRSTYAVIAGLAGAGLVTAGIVRYALHRETITITPSVTSEGAALSVAGRF